MRDLNDLDDYGQDLLDKRVAVGNGCIDLAAGHDVPAEHEDRETYATDAISDILTAVLGPRGYYEYRNDVVSGFVGGEGIVEQAQALLDRSLESWRGDSEDYSVGNDDSQPEPGEYGYEEPESEALTPELASEIRTALEGDSNDAEHDALVSVAQHFGIEYDPDAAF